MRRGELYVCFERYTRYGVVDMKQIQDHFVVCVSSHSLKLKQNFKLYIYFLASIAFTITELRFVDLYRLGIKYGNKRIYFEQRKTYLRNSTCEKNNAE